MSHDKITNLHSQTCGSTPAPGRKCLIIDTCWTLLLGTPAMYRQRCCCENQIRLDTGGVDDGLGRSPCRLRELIHVASKKTVGNELSCNSPVRLNWIRRGYGRYKQIKTDRPQSTYIYNPRVSASQIQRRHTGWDMQMTSDYLNYAWRPWNN